MLHSDRIGDKKLCMAGMIWMAMLRTGQCLLFMRYLHLYGNVSCGVCTRAWKYVDQKGVVLPFSLQPYSYGTV